MLRHLLYATYSPSVLMVTLMINPQIVNGNILLLLLQHVSSNPSIKLSVFIGSDEDDN